MAATTERWSGRNPVEKTTVLDEAADGSYRIGTRHSQPSMRDGARNLERFSSRRTACLSLCRSLEFAGLIKHSRSLTRGEVNLKPSITAQMHPLQKP